MDAEIQRAETESAEICLDRSQVRVIPIESPSASEPFGQHRHKARVSGGRVDESLHGQIV